MIVHSEPFPFFDVWKPIPGYPGYEITRNGQIRSYWTPGKSGSFLSTKPRLVAQRFHNKYWSVKLTNEDGRSNLVVHRLIWRTFVGEIPPGKFIDHIDINAHNNTLTNLRVATPSQNARNRKKQGQCGYYGVIQVKGQKIKYLSAVYLGGKRVYTGTFDTAKEAAKARDEMLLQYYTREDDRKFLRLNF